MTTWAELSTEPTLGYHENDSSQKSKLQQHLSITIMESNLACVAFNFSLPLFLFFQFSLFLHQVLNVFWVLIHF